jgi:hypothetical protein
MVSSVVQAGGRAVNAVIHGKSPIVDQAEADRRYSICLECPRYLPGSDQCGVCNCYLKHAKRWLSQEHCPDVPSRW